MRHSSYCVYCGQETANSYKIRHKYGTQYIHICDKCLIPKQNVLRGNRFTLNVDGVDVEYKYIGLGGEVNRSIEIKRYLINYENRVGKDSDNIVFFKDKDSNNQIIARTRNIINYNKGIE